MAAFEGDLFPVPMDDSERRQEAITVSKQAEMTPEQSFFAVFCIEALADELETTGNEVYAMLTERSDILDGYVSPHYDVLHTQGRDYIVYELIGMMKKQGVLS